jgi:hypothetical protein
MKKQTAKTTKTTAKKTTPATVGKTGVPDVYLKQLPSYIKPSDLIRPKWDSNKPGDSLYRDSGDESLPSYLEFELLYTERFGWVVTTLLIARAGRRDPAGTTDRSYAISLAEGDQCRVGRGPHVKATATLYGRKSERERLAPFFKRYVEGLTGAGDTRDRISTRRMQSARRGYGGIFGGIFG